MSEQLNSGKGLLKKKFGDFRVNPPDEVWNSIASRLDKRNNRKKFIIILSAAASLALAVTLGINFFGPKLPEGTGIAESHKHVIQEPKVENENAGSRMDQIAKPESGQDQPTTSQNGHVQLKTTKKEMRRDRLEEKVLRTMGDIKEMTSIAASHEPIEAGEESLLSSEEVPKDIHLPLEDTALVEAQETMNIVETSVQDEKLAGKQIVKEKIPDKEKIISDPVPGLQEKKRKDPRWMIGAALSPLYSFRDAESSAMAGASEFESGTVAYAGGVHVSYRTASRLAIESGIFYNKLGISIGAPGIQLFNESFNFSPLNHGSDQTKITTVTNSVGNIIARSGEVFVNNYKLNAVDEANSFSDNTYFNPTQAEQGMKQHLDYLELPFNLRYTLVDRTLELQIIGGMSTNFLVNNYVTMETSEGITEIGYLTNIRSVNYSGNAGLGMIYHFRDQFSLHLEPRFRYFLNSVNDATLPSTRPYSLGIFTGLSYTF